MLLFDYQERIMTTELDPATLAEKGKRMFAEKKFGEAAELFKQASQIHTDGNNKPLAAEMQNNLSVALLQSGKPQEALDAALGTDEYFASINDVTKQAMALGNQAAALEALNRLEEAIQKYERSAELFGLAGEGDMRAMVMKSAAAIKLKTGKVTDSAFKMMGALEAKDNPSIFERILKFFMRFTK
jgi:tetratricopeptide (TPR) repeat protein